MWILRINKDKTLTELYHAETFEELKTNFELQVIYSKCRGLTTDKEDLESGLVELKREGKYECTIIMAKGIAFNIIQEEE